MVPGIGIWLIPWFIMPWPRELILDTDGIRPPVKWPIFIFGFTIGGPPITTPFDPPPPPLTAMPLESVTPLLLDEETLLLAELTVLGLLLPPLRYELDDPDLMELPEAFVEPEDTELSAMARAAKGAVIITPVS